MLVEREECAHDGPAVGEGDAEAVLHVPEELRSFPRWLHATPAGRRVVVVGWGRDGRSQRAGWMVRSVRRSVGKIFR